MGMWTPHGLPRGNVFKVAHSYDTYNHYAQRLAVVVTGTVLVQNKSCTRFEVT